MVGSGGGVFFSLALQCELSERLLFLFSSCPVYFKYFMIATYIEKAIHSTLSVTGFYLSTQLTS